MELGLEALPTEWERAGFPGKTLVWLSEEETSATGVPCTSASQLEGAHESPGPGENTHSDLGGGGAGARFCISKCCRSSHWPRLEQRALCHISKFTSSHPVTELLLSPSCREVLDYVNLFPHPLPHSPPPSVLNAPHGSTIYLGTTHQHIIDSAPISQLKKLSTVTLTGGHT